MSRLQDSARRWVKGLAHRRGQSCHPFPCTVADLIGFLGGLDPKTAIVTTYPVDSNESCGFETAPLQLCQVDLDYVEPEDVHDVRVIHLTGNEGTTRWVGVCRSMMVKGWQPPDRDGTEYGGAP